MKKIISLLVIVSLTVLSCSYSTYFIQTGSKMYNPTNPDAVKIYSGNYDKDYIVIGSIAINHIGQDNALGKLREIASELGADAVIFLTVSKINSSDTRTGLSGVAIKFRN